MIKDLVFARPEEEGLSSKFIEKFLDKLEKRRINIHSFMFVRSGKILAEGYCAPYDKNTPHRLFSCSKSIVSLAVGKLVGEGKIKLTDRIVDFFPEYAPKNPCKWFKEYTIEDALKMSAPMAGVISVTKPTVTNWLKDVIETYSKEENCNRPAGTIFAYDTSNTYFLSAVVEKVTGKDFLDYLRPEFDKLGVSKDVWCVKYPEGKSWSGSGIMLTLRDFAKVGELVLNKGKINGEELIPYWYMEKATSKQINNNQTAHYSGQGTTGYGYQIWVNPRGYHFSGLAGQFVFCNPEKDFMFVCMADLYRGALNGDYIYDALEEIIYDNLSDEPIIDDGKNYLSLKERLSGLEQFKAYGKKYSSIEEKINGVRYVLKNNRMGWKWFKFVFETDKIKLTYENDRGVKNIEYGRNEFISATFPETHYYDVRMHHPANREFDARFNASWNEEDRLLLRNYIVDINLANCFMSFIFKGDEVGVVMNVDSELMLEEYQGVAGGEKE